MISEKMKTLTANSSQIRAMFEEGAKMAEVYGAENVYDFSLGNPSVEPPRSIGDAIKKELDTSPPNFLHGYTTSNCGYEDVRRYVSESLNNEFGTDFTYESIVLTCGAAGGLNVVFKAILNPGDEVIVFSPYFGEYNNYVSNFDGVVVAVPPDISSFQINFEAFEASITKKTKAVLINTPNNPTGVVYSEDTIKRLAEIMTKKSAEYGIDIALVSDEPYRYLSYDGVKVPYVPKYYKNTFVIYSFSKALSLPGERIGFIAVSNQIQGFDETITALNVANRILGFVNAPTLFQRILPVCMKERVDINIYDKNRLYLYDMLTKLGYECVRPNGAFYMFPKSIIEDDVEFCSAAKKYRLLIVPGKSFGCPGHFRIAYCTKLDTIKNSYDSFKKLAEEFR